MADVEGGWRGRDSIGTGDMEWTGTGTWSGLEGRGLYRYWGHGVGWYWDIDSVPYSDHGC